MGYIYHGKLLLSITTYFSDVFVEMKDQKLPIEIVDPLIEVNLKLIGFWREKYGFSDIVSNPQCKYDS